MMQAQPNGMIQINYKKGHFDEIKNSMSKNMNVLPLHWLQLHWFENDKKISF